MKHLFFILICLLAPFLSAKIVFDTTTVDGGKAKLDESKFVAKFPFKNTGEETVTLVSIKSECGCTVAETENKVYAPGESGEITAIFDFGVRWGEQAKKITVITDETPQQRIDLHLKIFIPQVLTIKPRVLFWEIGKEPTPESIMVSIDGESAVDVMIEPTDSVQFDIVMAPAVGEAQGNYVITVTPNSMSNGRSRFKILALNKDGNQIGEQSAFLIVRKPIMPRSAATRAPAAP